MTLPSLLSLSKDPNVKALSRFCDAARELDVGALRSAYDELVASAPRRHERGKRYLGERRGITSSGSQSNRREEHLSVALYNASREGRDFQLPDGRRLSIIDYQTPLKARRDDRGIGKLDLLAVAEPALPCVIELKVAGRDGAPTDTPLRALLEGLAYCAVLEANLADVAEEAREELGIEITTRRPCLLVTAPEDYWRAYLSHPRAGDWRPAIENLISSIGDELGLEILLLALVDARFEMGLEGRPARLLGECQMTSVAQLASSLVGGEVAARGAAARRASVRSGQVRALCEEALAAALRRTKGGEVFREDWPQYVRRPEDNLVDGVRLEDIAADFGDGAGSELAPRGAEPPKFCAAHSSAALVANAFGPFRTRPEALSMFGLSDFTDLRFEATCPTGLGGTPPHLDVLLCGDETVLAIESKCTEYLTPKPAKFSASYDRLVDTLFESAWLGVYELLKREPDAYAPLDAAQLVKHYLGLRNTFPGRRVTLAYLYWEPLDADSFEIFTAHRAAARRLEEATRPSSVELMSLSYSDLVASWLGPSSPTWLREHAGRLRTRYCLRLLDWSRDGS